MPIPTGPTQVCRDCRRDLPISKFSRAGRKDGFRRPECRQCQHARSKQINPNYQYTEGSVAARAAHTMTPGEVSKIKTEKIRSQNGECVYCTAKITVSTCHLDHRTPLARGGTNERGNLQALCAPCNSEKHSKTHEEYIVWLVAFGQSAARDRSGEI
ncbi:HNH endonuclease signature motif containing protein [Kandeliimicrobium roseum]|uniref:HNH endonuclease n=1 Tax=Oceaniglobus roseus TaxID=1737570 RepID=UPI000C7EF8BE